jgi:plastocyanin
MLISLCIGFVGMLLLGLSLMLTVTPAQGEHAEHIPQSVTTVSDANAVTISGAFPNFAFSPNLITVTLGAVVTWTNSTASPHTVTGDAPSPVTWGSGTINPSGIFTQAFGVPGVYPYHCSFHLTMLGQVVVLAPPGWGPKAYLTVVMR